MGQIRIVGFARKMQSARRRPRYLGRPVFWPEGIAFERTLTTDGAQHRVRYNSKVNLAGVFAPIPTPFDESGEVSTSRLARALARWTQTPLAGFVVLGSNGEAPFLDERES